MGTSSLTVNHQSEFPAATLCFNLAPGVALSQATKAIEDARGKLGAPDTLNGAFQGTAQAFQQSLSSEPVLILAALIAVYVILGVLYESFIHPLTILSTLPSAGLGALLALKLAGQDLNVIGIIAIILLIGIVKKNGIMIVDVALRLEREHDLSAEEAVARGVAPAVPADPDDHRLRRARRRADDPDERHRLGVPPAAGLRHRRRPAGLAGADPVHHAGDLHLPRPAAELAEGLAREGRFGRSRRRWRDGRRAAAGGAARHDAPASRYRRRRSLAMAVSGCTVGPDYQRPSAPISPSFKEAAGWTPSHPADAIDKGAWWSMFNDPVLDGLERRVAISNQTVKQYEAAYREAHADRVAGAGLLSSQRWASTRGPTGLEAPDRRSPTRPRQELCRPEPYRQGRRRPEPYRPERQRPEPCPRRPAPPRRRRTASKRCWKRAGRPTSGAGSAAPSRATRRWPRPAPPISPTPGWPRRPRLAQDYFAAARAGRADQSLYRDGGGLSAVPEADPGPGARGHPAASRRCITAETQLYGAQATLVAVGVMRAKMEHAIAVLVRRRRLRS